MSGTFHDRDLAQLADRGITLEQARQQLERLRGAVRPLTLVRPCTIGDGIVRIAEGEVDGLLDEHASAARDGRIVKFVPASGAATRMFRDLHPFHRGAGREQSWLEVLNDAQAGPGPATTLATLLREIRRFAFYSELRRRFAERGEDLDGLARVGAFQPIVDELLGSEGLDYSRQPKGLIPFHAAGARGRTAFEEHLVEAAHYARDGEGRCRLHFTVTPEGRAAFERHLEQVAPGHAARLGVRFEVGFSTQKPSTDTLATDARGVLLRDGKDLLRFRPAGHGSLIENLNDLGGDLILIKNIDNVQPDRTKALSVRWKKLLAGYLVRLERRVHGLLDRLCQARPDGSVIEEGLALLQDGFGQTAEPPASPPSYQCQRAFLIQRLNRPLRVCGVVPNTGEPGGGPFWVGTDDDGPRPQIVESAQVAADAAQQSLWRGSTHFNPVDLACAVRDAAGACFDLRRFVDEDAVIVTRKSEDGRELRALERPGLWNGGMAGWNTVFVEVPLETFSPVKTVLDLLRPEHR